MNDTQRQKRLDRAKIRLLFQVPFFAPGVMRLNDVFKDGAEVETACTDGKVIKWGRQFMDGLTDDQLVTVMCHEVCHCLLGHLWRAPGGCDWDVWNQAIDHATNLMLKEFSEGVMAKRLADPFPFPEPADSYLADPAFKGLAEEVIYGRLSQKPKQQGGGNKPGAGSGASGQPRGGKGTPQPGNGQGKAIPGQGKGSMPSFGQVEKPGLADPAAQKQLKTEWDHTLIQSVTIAKGRGQCPAGVERLVDGLLNPQIPWYELLRVWLRERASDDYSWMRPNRLYQESGFILPVLESEKIGLVVFATDTSGSIDRAMLAQFQSEKQSCLDDLKPARLVDIYCDAKIHKEAEYTPGDVISKDAPGGGGTDFRPVFERVASLGVPVKCLVYLTDLDGSFPEVEPDYPVLWVTWWKAGQAPFGEVIYAG